MNKANSLELSDTDFTNKNMQKHSNSKINERMTKNAGEKQFYGHKLYCVKT